MYCKKCGKQIPDDSGFCMHCGESLIEEKEMDKKLDQSEEEIDDCTASQFGEAENQGAPLTESVLPKKKSKKWIFISGAVLLFIVAAVVSACVLFSKFSVSVDELLSHGKYQEAYDKADDDRKEDILNENLAGYLYNKLVDYLHNEHIVGEEDGDFVKLQNSYIGFIGSPDSGYNHYVILQINGNNIRYGDFRVYAVYEMYDGESTWKYQGVVRTLEDESRDSLADAMNKLTIRLLTNDEVINGGNETTKNALRSFKLSAESIENIMSLFEKNLLGNVELIQGKNFENE